MHAILYDQHYPESVQRRVERMNLWANGIDAQGGTFEFVKNDPNQFGDFGISWGPRATDAIQPKCLRHIIMECGFLGDRLSNFFVGAGGLNGAGELPGAIREGAGERWRESLRPQKKTATRRVVVLGQVSKDANLTPLSFDESKRTEAYARWVRGVEKICEFHGLEIGWRGHPKDQITRNEVRPKSAIDFDKEGWSKEAVWEWADVAVAFNSNALVEAFMAGLDVVPGHIGSLTWDVRSAINTHRPFSEAERIAWLDKVASFQWSANEIKHGDAFDYLCRHF